MRETTDILVSGGGLAGLIAAAACAADGRRVTLAEPHLPNGDAPDDLRSTALLEPSIAFLDEIGLWPALAALATDLVTMRLIDAGGRENAERARIDFDAAEIGQTRFGANVPNTAFRRTLAETLASRAHVTLRPSRVMDVVARDDQAIATLSDGSQVGAALVVAADGRESPLRRAAGIGVHRTSLGQQALVFAVRHEEPHSGISTEIHRTGGPFTLVPLADREGVPHSAVVWMEDGREAGRLMALEKSDFEAALNDRSLGCLGSLQLASERRMWPIITQIARSLTARRLALIAEAAHVMPPIGAQGLNTSIGDISALRDAVRTAGSGDVGGQSVLLAYARARQTETTLRVAGVEALNRAAHTRVGALRDLRAMGLNMLGRTPLRRAAMAAGLGGRLLPF